LSDLPEGRKDISTTESYIREMEEGGRRGARKKGHRRAVRVNRSATLPGEVGLMKNVEVLSRKGSAGKEKRKGGGKEKE